MKLPHWTQLVLAFAVVAITWVMNQASAGQLVLPAVVVTILTAVKTLIGLFTDAVGSGTSSGGGAVSRVGSSGSNGPTPPMAARLGRGVYRLVFPALAVLACAGCVNGQPTPQTVQDVTIGLNAAMCVLTTYATDMQAGKSEGDAIADAAIKCGVSLVQATGVLDAHKRAETLEAKR